MKQESRHFSDERFKSDSGKSINADVNGAYQIMKKVFPNVFDDGIEDAGLHPVQMKIA